MKKYVFPLALFCCVSVSVIGWVFLKENALAAEAPAMSIAVVRNIDGPRYYLAEVTNIVDGDTVDLRFRIWSDMIFEKRMRFDNIDIWEARGENKEKGLAAKECLAGILKKGKVYLRTMGEYGNFGRVLGSLHVLTDDKMIDVSEELRKNGHEKN